jgi:thioredoxin reductase (NADPH)
MSIIETRASQMFPVLTASQMDAARRFASGPATRFDPDTMIYEIGGHGAPAWFVLAGTINVVRRDGLSGEAPITTHSVGSSPAK